MWSSWNQNRDPTLLLLFQRGIQLLLWLEPEKQLNFVTLELPGRNISTVFIPPQQSVQVICRIEKGKISPCVYHLIKLPCWTFSYDRKPRIGIRCPFWINNELFLISNGVNQQPADTMCNNWGSDFSNTWHLKQHWARFFFLFFLCKQGGYCGWLQARRPQNESESLWNSRCEKVHPEQPAGSRRLI